MLEQRKIKRFWSLLRFTTFLKCFWFSILFLNHLACSLGVGQEIKEGNEVRDDHLPKDGTDLKQAKPDTNRGVVFTREEVEQRRRELKDLSPEERRKRIQAWRERHAGFKSRLEFQLNSLKQKMENGTITDEERRRLSRLETVAKRFAESDWRHQRKESASDPKPSLKKSTQGEKKP